MPIYTAAIASGSNGNCYYVGNDTEGVLVDIGISCAEVETRMSALGLPIQLVKAIFITHEHSDHVKGLNKFAKKYKIPVFVTKGTWDALQTSIPQEQVFRITDQSVIQVGGLRVFSFIKPHDAAEPVSVIVYDKFVKVGVFTDIGFVTNEVKQRFAMCHAVFLEFNYELEMLQKGRYPHFLKKRIASDVGHLSNEQAFELCVNHKNSNLKLLVPSHLSGQNNSTEVVMEYFKDQDKSVHVEVAPRHKSTPLFKIDSFQTVIIEQFYYQQILFT